VKVTKHKIYKGTSYEVIMEISILKHKGQGIVLHHHTEKKDSIKVINGSIWLESMPYVGILRKQDPTIEIMPYSLHRYTALEDNTQIQQPIHSTLDFCAYNGQMGGKVKENILRRIKK